MRAAVVIRKAVLMEDEGREQLVQRFDTEDEARAWVAAQEGEYFGPSDYYVAVSS